MKIFRYNLKIQQQLIALFLIFAILPSGIILLVTFTANSLATGKSENEIQTLQLKSMASIANDKASTINNFLTDQTKSVSLIANDPIVRESIGYLFSSATELSGIAQLDKMLNNWVVSYSTFSEITVLNYTTGAVIISRLSNGYINSTTRVNEGYFNGAKSKENASTSLGTVFFQSVYKANGEYRLAFSQVIKSSSHFPLAILFIIISPNQIWDLIAPRDENNEPIYSFYNNSGLGSTGEVYLINNNGLAISRSRFITNDSNFILQQDLSTIQGYIEASKNGYSVGETQDYRQKIVYGAYVYLGFTPQLTDHRDSFFVEHLTFDLHWVLAITIDKNEVLLPVIQIQDIQNASLLLILILLTVMTVITVIISRFTAGSFSKPILNLSKFSKSISNGDLTVDVQKTSKLDEIGDLHNDYLQMINFLKPAVVSISGVAKTLSQSAQEMASSSEEVNASSDELSSISQQIALGAQNQSKFLGESLQQMKDLQKLFLEKISGIKVASELVEGISKQVNMLSLNASIEAARAGEYGRGFAVVADNIRRLASDAKESVDKVNRITSDLLLTITNGMASLSSTMVNVTSVAEETASGAEEASAASEQQAATMQELALSAQELAKVSSDLEEIVRKFKI